MAAKKQYGSITEYEEKLKRVMQRFGVAEDEYNYDWTRQTAYVQFKYKEQWYKFDHSIEKANASGKQKLIYGTDVFAQLVLTLEDLARMVERNIYDLSTWVSGMKYLPQKKELPACFGILGFSGDFVPTEEELDKQYRIRRKEAHPDNGGSAEEFSVIQEAYKRCVNYIKGSDNKI